MSATLLVRHTVADYATWRKGYDEADPLRAQYGCTAHRVMQLPDNPNDVLVTHDFDTVDQATGFAHDPTLGAAMENAGVVGQPRIEIFASA